MRSPAKGFLSNPVMYSLVVPPLGSRQAVLSSQELSTQAEGKAGAYEWFTYEETEALVFDIASAMNETGVSAHEKCSIYGSNCAQWMIAMQVLNSPLNPYILRLTCPAMHSLSDLSCLCAWHAMAALKEGFPCSRQRCKLKQCSDKTEMLRHVSLLQACNRQSIFCVPLYDSLGENAVEFIINHSESSILFVARDKLPTVIAALPKAHKGLKTLVYWGTHDERHSEADEASRL